MYPEFIAIYVMLAIVIVLLGVAIVILLKLTKNVASNSNSYTPPQQPNNLYYGQQYQQPYQPQYQPQAGRVVFCKQCATQFDASQDYCPNCGARR